MRRMKKNFTEKYLYMGKKALLLAALAGMLAGTAGCSGKETVLLDAEDLVSAEDGGVFTEEVSGDSLGGRSEGGKAPEQVEESTLFIHICGAVEKPGVYELPAGSRIYEAVEEAGGFTQEAADDYLNLAHRLEDGWKIEIPARKDLEQDGEDEAGRKGEETEYRIAVVSGIAPDAGSKVGSLTGTGEAGESADGASDGLVDINTAGAKELQTLPGVGESRAQSIISYREKNGGFSRIEDIMKVEGIKEGMFAKMKDKICVRGVR